MSDIKEKKEKAVKPVDQVTVYATEKLKAYYKVGDPIKVHSVQAEKMIESGKATKEAPKAK